MSASSVIAKDLRAILEPLSWSERFDRIVAAEKQAASADERDTCRAIRAEMADEALDELARDHGTVPLKDTILRLSSKNMRAALGQAAKRGRDRAIVQLATREADILERSDETTPPIGIGFDERVIEVPLALAAARLHVPGEVLDAGSALNVPVVRSIVGRPAARVTHLTLPGVDEPTLPGHEDQFTHARGDLRALSFPDGYFDRVVCVSTLEHVGMDNSRYGADAEPTSGSATDAVRELVRVLAPGGELLLTVPYGRRADHGWFRVLDAADLDELLEPIADYGVALRFFYYANGWTQGGPQPPAAVLGSDLMPDVVTGIAVARLANKRTPQ